MTKHTKIPMPPKARQGSGQATLIERVVRNYGLVRLAPAPIPDALIPPAAKRRWGHPGGSLIAR